MIKEIQAKTVLTHHEDAFPTNWDLNPYRGCTIGCRYCFAQYSHFYLGFDDFFKNILVKTNVADRLAIELKSKKWQHEQIKIGGIADLYQHAEKKYELMPRIFDVIKKHRNPIFIQTKSTLLLRDFDIIKELSKYTTVDISVSICTLDESIRKVLEPGAAPAIQRMEMLARFKGICRSTTLAFIPIIPLLSDNEENLNETFRLTKSLGIDNIVTSFLHLRNKGKASFLETIKTHFPHIYQEFSQLYTNSTLNESYANTIKAKIVKLRNEYDLHGVFVPVAKAVQPQQLLLF